MAMGSKEANMPTSGITATSFPPSQSQSGDTFISILMWNAWEAGLIHGEKLGIGTREYELIDVK